MTYLAGASLAVSSHSRLTVAPSGTAPGYRPHTAYDPIAGGEIKADTFVRPMTKLSDRQPERVRTKVGIAKARRHLKLPLFRGGYELPPNTPIGSHTLPVKCHHPPLYQWRNKDIVDFLSTRTKNHVDDCKCMRASVSGLMALLVLWFFPLNIFIHSFTIGVLIRWPKMPVIVSGTYTDLDSRCGDTAISTTIITAVYVSFIELWNNLNCATVDFNSLRPFKCFL